MSATTKYYQVMTNILRKIQSGEYRINDLLPTEKQFSEEYAVSRITIRKALDSLAAEGWIYKVQGKGTFASKPEKKGIDFTSVDTSCAAELESRGFVVHRDLRKSEVIVCCRELAQKHDLIEGEKYFIYERVYNGNGFPISYEKGYYLYRRVEGIEKHNFVLESIVEVLGRQYGFVFNHDREIQIKAIMPDEKLLHIMQLEKNTPLIQAKVRIFDSEQNDGVKVCLESTELFWRTDLVPVNL